MSLLLHRKMPNAESEDAPIVLPQPPPNGRPVVEVALLIIPRRVQNEGKLGEWMMTYGSNAMDRITSDASLAAETRRLNNPQLWCGMQLQTGIYRYANQQFEWTSSAKYDLAPSQLAVAS